MPRAMTPSASSGSNIFGKIVTKSILIDALRQIDFDSLAPQIDFRADRLGEGNFVFLAVAATHVQQHSAAPFVRFDDFAAVRASLVDEMRADEIVQEVLVSFEFSGSFLGNLDGPLPKLLDFLGGVDLGEFHERAAAMRPARLDRDLSGAFFVRGYSV